ncbi:hypothetical protein FUA48_05660 [Flavobacterium alkalisoli]|uniref:Uncharacterized protein n=1 Tax=Flavobacterium alkalisoli TaxID=2602769 RepID=A0A5B9FP64_9FLAO|nr:hypothetical protein FUA48_05660 [Flavobacterium alkalisoli]
MNIEKIKYYVKNNYPAFIIGVFFLLLFLQFTFAGNRICDCEKTEKYNSASNRTHSRAGGVNHFYHK